MTKIECRLCGAAVHSIQLHLKEAHAGELSIAEYRQRFADAPILSEMAQMKLRERIASNSKTGMTMEAAQPAGVSSIASSAPVSSKQELHRVFGISARAKAAFAANGNPIPITVLGDTIHKRRVPEKDENYVWDIELLKTVLMGIELNIPTYLFGHTGTGKSTLVEQICHYTNRPWVRVQHSANIEEAHVLGEWKVKNGETFFAPGFLPQAMLNGWLYCADEYDFSHPSILSVYQAVLEGKPLVIMNGDDDHAVVHPHPDFRIVATGNTNGAGDETGLYQGTNLQNAANYSRFGLTVEVGYMEPKTEVKMVERQGRALPEDADLLVRWANEIRRAYEGKKIGVPVGPRELINAARIGALRANFVDGIKLAITNRMSSVDREIAEGIAQRILGSS